MCHALSHYVIPAWPAIEGLVFTNSDALTDIAAESGKLNRKPLGSGFQITAKPRNTRGAGFIMAIAHVQRAGGTRRTIHARTTYLARHGFGSLLPRMGGHLCGLLPYLRDALRQGLRCSIRLTAYMEHIFAHAQKL